jgi:pimeloyl-ACP methyl ester carboxylesterase
MVAALRHDRAQWAAAVANPWFGVGLPGVFVSPEMVRWGIGLFLQASPKAAIDMLRMFTGADLRPDLRAITVPTLIVHGADDVMAPLKLSGRKAAEAIPHSELKVYENASHEPFVSHNEHLNDDLHAFVEGVTAACVESTAPTEQE